MTRSIRSVEMRVGNWKSETGADATPLYCLIFVDEGEILSLLFGHLYIPAEVREELTRGARRFATMEKSKTAPSEG